MSGVFKLFRSGEWRDASDARQRARKKTTDTALDRALDTVAAMLRSYGRDSFDVDDVSATEIAARCEAWAQHVLTGAPLPNRQRRVLAPEDRSWAGVRRFFSELRREESRFVGRSLDTMRGVLWDFVSTLRHSFDQDRRSDDAVVDHLETLRAALTRSSPEEIREAATRVAQVVDKALVERRSRHDEAIRTLGTRLKEVRSDLREAQVSAETDAMTGLPNRASFDERIRASVTLHAFADQPECLLMLDLDHFKRINDEHGHRAGDAVLAAVGELLLKLVFRRSDFSARFGGEEFAVILDDTSEDEGIRVADRLIKACRTMTTVFEGRQIRVTCSIGVAGIRPGDDEGSWLEAADQALYKAKNRGRDRVERRVSEDSVRLADRPVDEVLDDR